MISLLLILCLFNMPYGYYELVRYLSLAFFAYAAYKEFKSERAELGIVFIILALMFQPFLKLAFGRVIWIIIDIVVAAFCLYILRNQVLKK